jgi:hypothetical protein
MAPWIAMLVSAVMQNMNEGSNGNGGGNGNGKGKGLLKLLQKLGSEGNKGSSVTTGSLGMSTPTEYLTEEALGVPIQGGFADGGIAKFFKQQFSLNGKRVKELDGKLYEVPEGVEFDNFTVDDLEKDEKTGEIIDLAIEEDEVQTRGQGILGNLSTLGSVKGGQIGMSTPLTPGGAIGQAVQGGYQPLMATGGLASFQRGGYADYYNPTSSSSQYAPRETITVPTKVKDRASIYQYVPSEVERLYTQQAADRAREMGLGAPSGSVLTAADPLSIEWNMAPQMMTGMEYANYPSNYGEEDSYYGGYGGGGGGIADLFASFMQDRPSRESRRRQRKEEKQATQDDGQRRKLLQLMGSMYGAPQDVTIAPPEYDYGIDYDGEDYGGGFDLDFEDRFDYWPDEYERAGGSAPGGEIAYPRMNGAISGPGSETSDDIPAMLSDGEFVTNAEALRGIGLLAGANKQDKEEQRMVGARKMYEQQREAQKFAEDLLK